ncbi:MAG: ATP-binding cassette domain-containing protein, partial [Janibacter sp.]|nr:ATP-binding cassette domain-containing protein [Janibacter sp.]
MLSITGLAKGFGGRSVLAGLDLEVSAGEVVALVGPNGVGKSTALRCVVGADTADAGEVLLGEHRLDTRQPQTRRAVCAVLGDLGILPDLTVAEHLDLLARGHSVDEPDAVVAGALDEAQITHVADQLPGTLSSGQAQRFALATAMVRPWGRLQGPPPGPRRAPPGRGRRGGMRAPPPP